MKGFLARRLVSSGEKVYIAVKSSFSFFPRKYDLSRTPKFLALGSRSAPDGGRTSPKLANEEEDSARCSVRPGVASNCVVGPDPKVRGVLDGSGVSRCFYDLQAVPVGRLTGLQRVQK